MSESVLGSLGDRASPFCLALSCRPVSLQLRWGQLENVLHNFPLPRSPPNRIKAIFLQCVLVRAWLAQFTHNHGFPFFFFLFLPFFLSLFASVFVGVGGTRNGGWGEGGSLVPFQTVSFCSVHSSQARSDTSLLFPICSHQDPLSSVHFSRIPPLLSEPHALFFVFRCDFSRLSVSNDSGFFRESPTGVNLIFR